MRAQPVVVACLHAMVFLAFMTVGQDGDESGHGYRVTSIAHAVFKDGATDVVWDRTRERLVACKSGGDLLVELDSRTGRQLSAHIKGEFNPQKIFSTPGHFLLLAGRDDHGPELLQIDAISFEITKRTALKDWRLYRVHSAALSPDSSAVWAASSPTTSSLYGSVQAALFRIDLENGASRIAGTDPDAQSAVARDGQMNRCVAIDAKGNIAALNCAERTIVSYDRNGKSSGDPIKLDFLPVAIPARFDRQLPIVAENSFSVLDVAAREIVYTARLSGKPRAVCVDEKGSIAFVSFEHSSVVAQIDLIHSRRLPDLDLSRPNGEADVVDVARGKDVAELIKLGWASAPDRLFALGFDGSLVVVAQLKEEK